MPFSPPSSSFSMPSSIPPSPPLSLAIPPPLLLPSCPPPLFLPSPPSPSPLPSPTLSPPTPPSTPDCLFAPLSLSLPSTRPSPSLPPCPSKPSSTFSSHSFPSTSPTQLSLSSSPRRVVEDICSIGATDVKMSLGSSAVGRCTSKLRLPITSRPYQRVCVSACQ
eukprot:TRINITY_DN16193_c0_g1_i1.p2 TRINITY_DN16193_c0_g1~~TRINITY_DN16193_c0_g1_i1.p2  ORF type:complete len:164 (+),score=39.33 TRINITY_DN16193_c0_g1_i1:114-605(+)